MIGIVANKSLAEDHWKDVSETLIKRLKKLIRLKEITFEKETVKLSDELEIVFRFLLRDDTLKKLIIAEPEELKKLIKDVEEIFPTFINRGDQNKKEANFKFLYNVFVHHGYNLMDNLSFIQRLQLDTCVYCNRSYTFHLDEKGEPKPEIDHFYPKGIYPFLAVSYFNLVPSCQTCNGYGGKHSSDTYLDEVQNPYLITNDDYRFSFDLLSLDFKNPISKKGAIKITMPKQIGPNTKLFKLEKLYQKHEDHVLELLVKSKLDYTEKYREYLKSYQGLNFSNSEIDRMIIGNYTNVDELHKRPLSKLYRDIALELGLIIE